MLGGCSATLQGHKEVIICERWASAQPTHEGTCVAPASVPGLDIPQERSKSLTAIDQRLFLVGKRHRHQSSRR